MPTPAEGLKLDIGERSVELTAPRGQLALLDGLPPVPRLTPDLALRLVDLL